MIEKIFNEQTKKHLKFWGVITLLITLPFTVYVTLTGRFLITKKAAEGDAIYHFLPTAGEFASEEEFQVDLKITSHTTDKVVIAKAVLDYDPDFLEVTNITKGNYFPGELRNEYNNQEGTAIIELNVGSGSEIEKPSGTFTFATITLRGTQITQEASLEFREADCYALNDNESYLNINSEPGIYRISESSTEAEAAFSLVPAETSAVEGETINTHIWLNTEKTVSIAGAILNFNPNLIKVSNITASEDLTDTVRLDHDNEQGIIRIEQGAGSGGPVNGEIDFAAVEFETLSAGTADISFDKSESYAVESTTKTYLNFNTTGATYFIQKSEFSGNGEEPEITAFAPACGPDGTAVSIIGSNFDSEQGSVTFGGTAGTVLSWKEDRINVEVPALELDSRETLEVTTAEGLTAAAPYSFLASESSPINKADLNCDQVVNSFDLGIMAHFWDSD